MDFSKSMVEGVVVMFAIIALAVFLKKINILNKTDELLFSRIVLHIILPARFGFNGHSGNTGIKCGYRFRPVCIHVLIK